MGDVQEKLSELLGRAKHSFLIGRWADALVSYEEALAVDESCTEARAYVGRCRLRLGQNVEAIEYLEAAISAAGSPEVVWWVELGEAYLSQRKDDKAASNFREAIERDPNQAQAYAGMGVLYLKKKAYRMAQTVLERAVALEHSLGAAHNNLAIVYCYIGNFERAIEQLSIARNLGFPVDPSFREMLAKQLIDRGQNKEEPYDREDRKRQTNR